MNWDGTRAAEGLGRVIVSMAERRDVLVAMLIQAFS